MSSVHDRRAACPTSELLRAQVLARYGMPQAAALQSGVMIWRREVQ